MMSNWSGVSASETATAMIEADLDGNARADENPGMTSRQAPMRLNTTKAASTETEASVVHGAMPRRPGAPRPPAGRPLTKWCRAA